VFGNKYKIAINFPAVNPMMGIHLKPLLGQLFLFLLFEKGDRRTRQNVQFLFLLHKANLSQRESKA